MLQVLKGYLLCEDPWSSLGGVGPEQVGKLLDGAPHQNGREGGSTTATGLEVGHRLPTP
jgi:hypothetical protein